MYMMDYASSCIASGHRDVFCALMWSYGDAECPHEDAVELLGELVHDQLNQLMEKSSKTAITRGQKCIGLVELVFEFRRHPFLLRRLLRYINNAEEVESIKNSLKERPKNDEEDSQVLGIYDDEVANHKVEDEPSTLKQRNNKLTRSSSITLACEAQSILDAIRQFEAFGELTSMVDDYAAFIDRVKLERMRLIHRRTMEMDDDEYRRFVLARQISFAGRLGKRQHLPQWNDWLAPLPLPLDPVLTPILNFCATEIVAVVVTIAAMIRDEEEQGEKGQRDEAVVARAHRALDLRHYQEAVRRNRGYARRKNILFGDF